MRCRTPGGRLVLVEDGKVKRDDLGGIANYVEFIRFLAFAACPTYPRYPRADDCFAGTSGDQSGMLESCIRAKLLYYRKCSGPEFRPRAGGA